MKIAFDFQIFSFQKFGGISRYFCDLATSLNTATPGSVRVVSPLHVNGYLENMTAKVVGIGVPEVRNSKKIVRSINLFASNLYLKSYSPDVLHETYYSTSAVKVDCPRIVTVFDMINEKFPVYFKNNGIMREKKAAIDRADRLICISEQTKSDLIEYMGIDPGKISVVYLGHSGFPIPNPMETVSNERPYFLYVGNREGYKNFELFVRAFASCSALNKLRIVCFGGGRFTLEELKLFASLNLDAERVHQINGDDSVLANLYANAELFVYPSLYEGFGIPPLEAMSCNCPVACSNTSSIPEVVGNAAAYFDPTSLDSMKDSMCKILDDSEFRSTLVARGVERVKLFSWEKCSRETLDVYRSVT